MAQHPALAQVDAYWEALRGGRMVPLRSEVDPRGIDKALEFAFVLERIAPGVARFRLAGMHLNDLMGMEVRGMPLTAFFAPEARDRINDMLEHVFEEPAKARVFLGGDEGIGQPSLTAELLLLPLKSDLGDVSRALGCLVSQGTLGRTPRRFVVRDLALEPLTGLEQRQVEPKMRPRVGRQFAEAPTGFAEPGQIYSKGTAARAPRRGERPYLRLIKSDD